MDAVLRHLRKLVAVEDCRSQADHELLRRFVTTRDESAFCALLERHGPMVLGVCRRVLRKDQDAEDALQATFLVLVRKAGSIRRGASVRSWLYGVAHRIACKARVRFARQRACERTVAEVDPVASPAETTWEALQAILDEEMQSLPEKYRLPLLLCCLDGKSRDEAAQELGWKPGAVKIRLERGRELLRTRLARRGVALSAVFSATLLSAQASAALPVRLVASLVEMGVRQAAGQSVVGLASASAIALAEGAMRTMTIAKLGGMVAMVVLGLAGIGAGAAGIAAMSGTFQPPGQAARPIAAPIEVVSQMPVAPVPAPAPAKPVAEKKDPDPVGPVISGTLRRVHAEGPTLTLRVGGTDRRVVLAPKAEIRLDGKVGRWTDLVGSPRIRATLSPDGARAVRIDATGRVLTCLVAAVDPVRSTLSVNWPKSDGEFEARTFPVAGIVVRLDRRTASLRDLTVGMAVSLHMSVDDSAVLKITAGSR